MHGAINSSYICLFYLMQFPSIKLSNGNLGGSWEVGLWVPFEFVLKGVYCCPMVDALSFAVTAAQSVQCFTHCSTFSRVQNINAP